MRDFLGGASYLQLYNKHKTSRYFHEENIVHLLKIPRSVYSKVEYTLLLIVNLKLTINN